MKIDYIIIFLSIGIIFMELGSGSATPAGEPKVISSQREYNEERTPENYNDASISKGTILLLLAVGVIGALGLSRKKNGNGSSFDRDSDDQVEQAPGAKENDQKIIGHKF